MAAVLGVVFLSVPSVAQDQLGRFTMKEIDDGLLRLDTQTGEVSYCRKTNATWACDTASDDRSVLADEVERLQEENAGLRNRLAELEKKSVDEDADRLKLPNDEDLDKVVDFMDRLMRRFYAFTKSMRDQIEDKKPGEDT